VTLQRTVTIVTTTMSALAVTMAVALIILTSALNQLSSRLGTAVERVRVLMELESDALQSKRLGEMLDTHAMTDILNRLQHGSDNEFGRDMRRLAGMIERAGQASTATDREAEIEEALTLLRNVVEREDIDAQRATALAASWNRVANVAGTAGVLVPLAGFVALLTWFGRRTLQPLVGIADAIRRFTAGDRSARAPEAGPAEFRQVAASFNEMALALQQQHDRQFALVAGIAHDLRNPLSALRVGGALLQRQPHEAMRIGERIAHQVDYLEQLVGDLLDRAQIEAGRLQLRLEVQDLRGVITRVVDEHRAVMRTRNFILREPDDSVRVTCDIVRIEQVIRNLLGNAVKYSPESTDIEVCLQQTPSQATVSIIDHGIGVTARDRERLFQPFVRGENVGSVGGLGLGLSVTRKILDAHGGQIEALNTPNGGSTFVVRLPLAPTGGASLLRVETDVEREPVVSG
jgi:two-component system, OmpR family, sensor histidine kinase MtrB